MLRTSTENAVQKFHLWFVFWRQLVVDSRLLGVCYDCQVYLVHLSQVVICYHSCWVSLSVVVFGSWLSGVCCPHCKEPIPKTRNKYSQTRNCAATVTFSTFMCLWAIYIFPRSIWLLCKRKNVDLSWEYVAHRHMNVQVGTVSAQFPEKENINGFSLQCMYSLLPIGVN